MSAERGVMMGQGEKVGDGGRVSARRERKGHERR